jgi:hypothetical protein
MENEEMLQEMLNPVVTDYNSFGAAVWTFNKLAGNLQPHESAVTLVQALRNQALRVLEEAQEIVDACNKWEMPDTTDEEAVEQVKSILDGVIDTNVTSFGLLQIAGPYMDTAKAATIICQNNLTKFHTTECSAEETVTSYGFDSANDRYITYLESVSIEGLPPVYVVKRYTDNKVMKPAGYVSVDLSECIVGLGGV